jgi:hypothetical protein
LEQVLAERGDAVEEAGLARNELIQAAPDDIPLEHVAEIVRQLKRFPVTGELRVRASADPSLPNERTFTRRFGGMVGL